MIIDGYAHCGISKYERVEVVAGVMEKAGVARSLLCQHLGEYDNTYLARVVNDSPEQFAAACLVDPGGSGPLGALRRLCEGGAFRGTRVLAEWLDPYFSLWREACDRGLRLVVFAPNGVNEAVPGIRRLLAECPGGRVVISHLGNPTVEAGKLTSGLDLFQLDQAPGVYVLLSGLSMFCEHPHTALQPFIRDLIDRFGAERVMWGSNFPVCGSADDYARDLQLVLAGHWVASQQKIKQIAGDTAREFWFDEGPR